VAFVTGGGTGIGLACARAIAAGGGKVMLAGRRENVLRDAAAEVGANAAWVVCDVTSDEAVDAAVAATCERLGPLRLAVNSAGAPAAGSVLNSTAPQLLTTPDTHLSGARAAHDARHHRRRPLPLSARRGARHESERRWQHRQHQLDRRHAHP